MNDYLKKHGQAVAVFVTCISVLLLQFWNIRAWANLPERVLKVEVVNSENLAKIIEMDKQGSYNLAQHKIENTKDVADLNVRLARLEVLLAHIEVVANDVAWIKKTLENRKP